MKKILVIDDERQMRKLLQQILEEEGFKVSVAADGNVGIEQFKKTPFDLVITDIIMPEKEGTEVIVELKHQFPDLKIIAISGGGRISPEEYLKVARVFGADQIITKPFNRDKIIETVNKII